MAVARKVELKQAADAAVLAAASMPTTTEDKMKTQASEAFKGNLRADLVTYAEVDGISVSAHNHITLDAHTRVPLTIGKILFQDDLKVSVSAQSVRSDYQKVEVAIVLDNTYSMSGQSSPI